MPATGPRELATERFIIDRAVSRFTVQAFSAGLLSAFGHNPTIAIRDYEGQVDFVPGSYRHASVRLTVQTRTLEVADEMKRDDRTTLENTMRTEVLDVEHYPDAVYQSDRIEVETVGDDSLNARVAGELALHGVIRPLGFEARVENMGARLRISGQFTLRQSDYGIKPVSFAAGALRLKDELKFSFEVVARKAEPRNGDSQV